MQFGVRGPRLGRDPFLCGPSNTIPAPQGGTVALLPGLVAFMLVEVRVTFV